MLPVFVFLALPTLSLALLLVILCRRVNEARSQPHVRHKVVMCRAMSRLEALRLLGLDDKADLRLIRAAYTRLMRQHHPDHGGSNQAAVLLNAARDTLLNKRARRAA